MKENEAAYFSTGEFAEQCGVTIRALQFYDRKNLLKPTGRTEGGRRLYSMGDMARLQHILTLKFIGLPLDEIKETLDKNSGNMNALLRKQRETIEEKIGLMQVAAEAIRQAEDMLGASGDLSVESIAKVIKAVRIRKSHEYCGKYFTDAQLMAIQENCYEGLDESHRKWDELVSLATKLASAGEDPASEAAQKLARRWADMVREFTAGDDNAEKSFSSMCKSGGGIDGDMRFIDGKAYAFVEQACAILKNRAKNTEGSV